MHVFGNVRIAARLGFGFAAIIMVMVASQFVAVSRVGEVSTRLTQINDLNSLKQRYAINFRGSVHDRSILMRDLVLFEARADIDRTLGEIEKLAQDYKDSGVKLDAMMALSNDAQSPEHKALADIKSVESRTLPLLDRVVGHASGQAPEDDVMAVVNEARPLFSEWLRVINVFIDLEEASNKGLTTEARAVAASFPMWMGVFGVAGVALAGAFAVMIVRSITGPIGEMQRVFSSVVGGDLKVRVQSKRGDELGKLARSFDEVIESIHTIISAALASTSQVASASAEIEANASQMASNVQAQTAEVMQASSALTELSASVNEVAGKAETTSKEAGEAGKVAREGADVVRTAVSDMQVIDTTVSDSAVIVAELGTKINKIRDIADVITDIADQTNLLALNAAIEAARAGENGRGFAVVADEVRKLAERTRQATEEVSNSIGGIQAEAERAVNQINTGTVRVKESAERATSAGERMQAIETKNARVASMISEIAASGREQAQATERITSSVEVINSRASEVSSGAAKSAHSATELRAKSEELRNLITPFRV